MGIPYGWLKSPASRIWWKKSPLVTLDNPVSQIYFRGGSIVDAQSVGWTMVGTVPQVAESGKIPPGAGAFSDANHYKLDPLGTGSDVLDFAGDFTAYILLSGSTGGAVVPFSDGAWGARGIYLEVATATNFFRVYSSNASTGVAVSASATWSSTLSLVCWGRSGTSTRIAANGGSMASAAPGYLPATAVPAYLGRYSGTGVAWSGRIHEAGWFATAADATVFNSIADQVRSRAGITAW